MVARTCPISGRMGAMDTAAVAVDPFLKYLRDALMELYGPGLDRAVLFGSRARGDAGEHADYDVAVFLRDVRPGMADWYRLADLRTRILEAGGPFVEAIPFPSSDYDRRTPIMGEIRRDGVIL
jgi:predicted nucleotidyltransferase